MTPDKLKEIVTEHYESSDEPLLLADLGKELRAAGLWPISGESRTLANVIRSIAPELPIVADPAVKAFVVITPPGREDLAEAAFLRRHELILLRQLPRAMLLAFCANTDQSVYFRKVPPYRYVIGTAPQDEQYVPVDDDLRLPGLYVDEALTLSKEDAKRLLSAVKGWSNRHSIDIFRMAADRVSVPATPSRPKASANALERLYAAQSLDLREQLVVPVDIALVLSRMP